MKNLNTHFYGGAPAPAPNPINVKPVTRSEDKPNAPKVGYPMTRPSGKP
jgi:hypothetical protein